MWRMGLLLVALLALPGCVTPVEVSSALEAPLPPDGTPFAMVATACGAEDAFTLVVVYPDGKLVHVTVVAVGARAAMQGDTRAPHSAAEKAVLDAVAAGALDAKATIDGNGRFGITHADEAQISAAAMHDLRTRVTLAGFPALKPSYGEVGCAQHYAAWADGQLWHVRESGDAAPWALRQVGASLRALHATA